MKNKASVAVLETIHMVFVFFPVMLFPFLPCFFFHCCALSPDFLLFIPRFKDYSSLNLWPHLLPVSLCCSLCFPPVSLHPLSSLLLPPLGFSPLEKLSYEGNDRTAMLDGAALNTDGETILKCTCIIPSHEACQLEESRIAWMQLCFTAHV